MSLLSQAERHRRRAVSRLVVLVGVVVLLVLVLVWGVLRATGGTDDTAGDDPAASVPTPVGPLPTAVPSQSGTWTMPPVEDGPLILPPSARVVDGVPVGYPHTTEGAISAAARYTQAAITLDAGQASRVGEVAAAPSYLGASDAFASAVQSTRRGLGVAATGSTGGAYLTYQPGAYLVRDATPDRVEVWILGIVDGAGPATGGVSRTGSSVAQHVMVWAEDDWLLTDTGDTPDVPAPAPGSEAAYTEGWRDLAIA